MRVLMADNDVTLIDRRVVQEARSLMRAGHDVKIISGFEIPEARKFVLQGVPVERVSFDWSDPRITRVAGFLGARPGSLRYRLAYKAISGWIRCFSTLNKFERHVVDTILDHDFDVLHVHDFPMLKAGVHAAGRRGVPLVYDAHELYFVHADLPEKTKRKYRSIEAKFIGEADAVITVNPQLAGIFSRLYGIPAPHVILNAVERKEATDRGVLRRKLGLAPTDRILLFQGWITEHRRLDVVLRAMQKLGPEVKVALIGYGDGIDTLKALAEELDIGDRVFFLGVIENEHLHEWTCGADFGVIPYQGIDDNYQNCSPNKLFEYLNAEVPLVMSDLPFLRSVVDQYGCGMTFTPGDPDSLARVLGEYLESESSQRRIWEGVVAAKRELNWEVEEKKLLQIYENLAT